MCPVNICNTSPECHYFVNRSITRMQRMNLPSMLFQSIAGAIGPICLCDMITTRRPVFDGFRVAASTYLISFSNIHSFEVLFSKTNRIHK